MEKEFVAEDVLAGFYIEWATPVTRECFTDPYGNDYTEEQIIRRNGRITHTLYRQHSVCVHRFTFSESRYK